MTFDCFPFFNELELLRLRLTELEYVVDKHVLVESLTTHTGKPKPLYYHENKHLFEKWANKIRHIIIRDPKTGTTADDNWDREFYQRDRIGDGLTDAKDGDTIIISDADEIPNPAAIAAFHPDMQVRGLSMKLYYYYLNCQNMSTLWERARICAFASLRMGDNTPCKSRYCDDVTMIPDGGWHFSYLGGVEAIRTKINAFCHQELNNAKWNSVENITKAMRDGKDLYGCNDVFRRCKIGKSFPKYVWDNVRELTEKGLII